MKKILTQTIKIIKDILGPATQSSKKTGKGDKSSVSVSFPEYIPMEYHNKIAKMEPLECGLYPPEVLMLYYCEQYQKYLVNYKNDFQLFWKNDYGVNHPEELLDNLVEGGFLESGHSEKGKTKGKIVYRATERGHDVITRYEGIIYSHKKRYILDEVISVWKIGYALEKKQKNNPKYTYRDIIWRYFCGCKIKQEHHLNMLKIRRDHENAGDDVRFQMDYSDTLSDVRMTYFFIAEFLMEEKRYIDALTFYSKVDDCDREMHHLRNEQLGYNDRYVPAEYIVECVNKCKKNIAENR